MIKYLTLLLVVSTLSWSCSKEDFSGDDKENADGQTQEADHSVEYASGKSQAADDMKLLSESGYINLYIPKGRGYYTTDDIVEISVTYTRTEDWGIVRGSDVMPNFVVLEVIDTAPDTKMMRLLPLREGLNTLAIKVNDYTNKEIHMKQVIIVVSNKPSVTFTLRDSGFPDPKRSVYSVSINYGKNPIPSSVVALRVHEDSMVTNAPAANFSGGFIIYVTEEKNKLVVYFEWEYEDGSLITSDKIFLEYVGDK